MSKIVVPSLPSLMIHLRAWRKSRHLTLEALAARIGSKVSTISGWETGRRIVGTDDWARLAYIYNVHPAALLAPPSEDAELHARVQTASSVVQRMSPEIVEHWLAIGLHLASEPRSGGMNT